MSQLKRIITALSTAAIVVLALIYVPKSVILPIMILLVAAVHLEFSQMIAKKYSILTTLGVVAGVAYMWNQVYGCGSCAYNYTILIPLIFILALRALFGKEEKPIEALATTILGLVYIPVMLTYFIMIAKLDMMLLLYVIAMIKFSDMGGFALGMLFGKHKMCPSISPKKSWEGMFGSLLAAVIMSVSFMGLTHYTLGKAILFGLAAAIIGTLGDLVESRFKREIGVKDSATFMPAGLGGFLDMFDSLIFAPALMYPFL